MDWGRAMIDMSKASSGMLALSHLKADRRSAQPAGIRRSTHEHAKMGTTNSLGSLHLHLALSH